MVSITFKYQRQFEKRIQRAANWGKIDRKQIKSANRKVGNVYIKALRGAIKDSSEDFTVYRDDTIYRVVQPGPLRRSLGNWTPRRDKSGTIMTGPRTATLGKRVTEDKDGWFAHFIEQGKIGKNKATGRNKGVFNRTLSTVKNQMRQAQYDFYRERFKKYMR